MSLSTLEQQWLLNRAWTCLRYQQPQQACIFLCCILEHEPDYFPAEKMLLVALLKSHQYQDVVSMADKMLERALSPSECSAVYLCRTRALFQLGSLSWPVTVTVSTRSH